MVSTWLLVLLCLLEAVVNISSYCVFHAAVVLIVSVVFMVSVFNCTLKIRISVVLCKPFAIFICANAKINHLNIRWFGTVYA